MELNWQITLYYFQKNVLQNGKTVPLKMVQSSGSKKETVIYSFIFSGSWTTQEDFKLL